MKILIFSLCIAVALLCFSESNHAATVTLLEDYDLTGDMDDIVHLGDNYRQFFYRPACDGIEWTGDFNLNNAPGDTEEAVLFIDHYYADHSGGHRNHLYLNGTDLGVLCDSTGEKSSPPSHMDLPDRWVTQQFYVPTGIFLTEQNVLRVQSSTIEDLEFHDDFEFTNLHIDYADAPLPSALWLLSSGLIGLLALKRDHLKKQSSAHRRRRY